MLLADFLAGIPIVPFALMPVSRGWSTETAARTMAEGIAEEPTAVYRVNRLFLRTGGFALESPVFFRG